MLSATKQAISIKLATFVGHFFYVTLTLTLQMFIWLVHLVAFSLSSAFVVLPTRKWVLETGREYEIYIEVYDTDSHKIYPSDVSPVLCLHPVQSMSGCSF